MSNKRVTTTPFQPAVEKFLSEHSLVIIGYKDNVKGVNLFHLLGLWLKEGFETNYPMASKYFQVLAIKKQDNEIALKTVLKDFQSCYHVYVNTKDEQILDKAIINLDFYTNDDEIKKVSGECILKLLYRQEQIITYYAEFVFFCNSNGVIEYDKRISIRSSNKSIFTIPDFLALPIKEKNYDFYRGDAEDMLSWRLDNTCIREGLKKFYQQNPGQLHIPNVDSERVRNLVSPLYYQVKDRFFQELQIMKMATIAANYWAGLVGNPGSNGDIVSDVFHVELLKKSQVGNLELFRENLIREIKAELSSLGTSLSGIILRTDYTPEGLLAKASSGTGVNLPWKTITWLTLVSFKTRTQIIFQEENLFDD